MNGEQVRRLYGVVAVTYVVAIAVAIIARDYLRERDRVRDVIAETIDDLSSRADEVAAIAERVIAEEPENA
jgi:hypothetical protein